MKPAAKITVILITIIILVLSVTSIVYYKYFITSPHTDNSSQEYIAAEGWIGAQLTELTQNIKQHLKYPDYYGVYIQNTIRNGPSQTAGILPGDIISKINNLDAQEVLPTLKIISQLNPGKKYPFIIFRDGKFSEYQITIDAKQ